MRSNKKDFVSVPAKVAAARGGRERPRKTITSSGSFQLTNGGRSQGQTRHCGPAIDTMVGSGFLERADHKVGRALRGLGGAYYNNKQYLWRRLRSSGGALLDRDDSGVPGPSW